MSARTLVPVAMVSALLMTTAAFAQTGGAGGSPGATAPGNQSMAWHRTRPEAARLRRTPPYPMRTSTLAPVRNTIPAISTI
jgi:hypothetical protein